MKWKVNLLFFLEALIWGEMQTPIITDAAFSAFYIIPVCPTYRCLSIPSFPPAIDLKNLMEMCHAGHCRWEELCAIHSSSLVDSHMVTPCQGSEMLLACDFGNPAASVYKARLPWRHAWNKCSAKTGLSLSHRSNSRVFCRKEELWIPYHMQPGAWDWPQTQLRASISSWELSHLFPKQSSLSQQGQAGRQRNTMRGKPCDPLFSSSLEYKHRINFNQRKSLKKRNLPWISVFPVMETPPYPGNTLHIQLATLLKRLPWCLYYPSSPLGKIQ